MKTFDLSPQDVSGISAQWPDMMTSGCIYSNGRLEVPDKHATFVEQLIPGAAVAALDAAKAAARIAIIARANSFTAPILSQYPEAERTGWDKREAEARAILAADDKEAAIAETVIIKALASAANESTADTVNRAQAIVAKAAQFAAISAAVEVMRDQALAAIEAVNNSADMPAALAALDAQAAALAKQYGLG